EEVRQDHVELRPHGAHRDQRPGRFLLEDDAVAEVVGAGPAEPLGDRHAHVADLAELAEEGPGGLARLFPLRVGGDDLPLDELADHPPEVLLLGGEDVAPHYAATSSSNVAV